MYADHADRSLARLRGDVAADGSVSPHVPPPGMAAPGIRPLPGPVAFVLPGGASFGAIQVGMLRALAAAGVAPDLLVATSVGGLNAAVFAADPTPQGAERLAAIWAGVQRRQIFPVGPAEVMRAVRNRHGHLASNEGLRAWIAAHVPFERLEDAPVPVHIMATDLDARRPVILSRGDAVTALLASCSIPGLFPTVHREGRRLIDGGVLANRPLAQAAALGARTIIELSTASERPGEPHTIKARLLVALDQRFGNPAEADSEAELGSADEAAPAVTGDHARPAPRPLVDVHLLPTPSTAGLNPFGFRHCARLIDEAQCLTEAWLSTRLAAPLRHPVPRIAIA